jgi:hypothetical protein
MPIKKFIFIALAILILVICALQFVLTEIGRKSPQIVGLLAFNQNEFMAFRHEYYTGDVYPIAIGMSRDEVDSKFSVLESDR